MDVQEHIPVFVLNGYEDLELFRELEPADLDYLRIHQPEHRAKILTAVQLLHDLQCEYLFLILKLEIMSFFISTIEN